MNTLIAYIAKTDQSFEKGKSYKGSFICYEIPIHVFKADKNAKFAQVQASGLVNRILNTIVCKKITIIKIISYENLCIVTHGKYNLPFGTYIYKYGKLHCEYEPALIDSNKKSWFINGKRHRSNDLPAIEFHNGTKVWYTFDNIHRNNDLPAVVYANGTMCWRYFGQLHRENGPAIKTKNSQEYFFLNKRHRENGPAYIGTDYTIFYVHGEIHAINTPAIEGTFAKAYVEHNLFHRTEGPAVIIKGKEIYVEKGVIIQGHEHIENDSEFFTRFKKCFLTNKN